MILTGQEILNRMTGKSPDGSRIVITPYKEANLNPNSYNLTLDKRLLVYTDPILDSKKDNPVREIIIPEEGLILNPGKLYLGSTVEYTETHGLIPVLDGRSSTARIGLFVHISAGLGDSSFCGKWTLELMAVQPLKIYPNMPLCQIVYHTVEGDIWQYNGKYQGATTVEASKIHKDLEFAAKETKKA